MNTFGYWLSKNYGLSDYVAYGSQFVFPLTYAQNTGVLNPQTYSIGFTCMSMYYNDEEMPEYCHRAIQNSLYGPV